MVTRKALPQNYFVREGTVIESFENISDWSIVLGSPTLSVDANSIETGGKSLRIITNVDTKLDKTFSTPLTFSAVNRALTELNFYYNGSDPFHDMGNGAISIYLFDSSGNNFCYMQILGTSTQLGWNRKRCNAADWTFSTNCTLDTIFTKMRVRLIPYLGKTLDITLDSVKIGVNSIPTVGISMPDGFDTQYQAVQYANSKGVRITLFVNPATIGSAGFMSWEQLQTLRDAGNIICSHSYSHPNLTTLTLEGVENEIQKAADALTAHGLGDFLEFFQYPSMGINETVFEALHNKNIKMAQWDVDAVGTEGIVTMSQTNPPLNYYLINQLSFGTSNTLTYIKSLVDYTIKTGTTFLIEIHRFTDGTPSLQNEMSNSDWHSFINYIVATKVKTQTYAEYYYGLSNPRYRSK